MEIMHLYAPQWQGSGLTRELYDGARALLYYIESRHEIHPLKLTVDIDTPPLKKNGILGYDLIISQLIALQQALSDNKPDRTLVIGGGCGIELPLVSYHLSRSSDTAVFWFDAHGDLNNPETSPSGHFHGMPLRFLLDGLFLYEGLRTERADHSMVLLLGTRDLDPAERDYIERNNLRMLGPSDFPLNKTLREIPVLPKARKAYIHIDLDVLDPGSYKNVKCPAADGITIDDLYLSILEIKDKYELTGISLLENTETDPSVLKMLDGVIEECIRIA